MLVLAVELQSTVGRAGPSLRTLIYVSLQNNCIIIDLSVQIFLQLRLLKAIPILIAAFKSFDLHPLVKWTNILSSLKSIFGVKAWVYHKKVRSVPAELLRPVL